MKKLFSITFFVCLLTGISANALAAEKTDSAPKLADQAKSAILIERDTGNVLYQKNSDQKLPPASMTKIMTMLLIMEAIDKGELKMTDKIRTSEHAASMGGSQIFLEPGEQMTAEEMLKGISIASGNDASVAMAEHLAGSVDSFVSRMNKKAEELGLKNTHFANPTGLPVENHYSTAHDMAIMAKELLKYEKITQFTGKYEDYLRENTDKKFWLVNTNRLVKFYPGVDGVKTGFTNEAKYCLTATAKKGNMRVIAVVFGAATPKDRNNQVTKMLDYAFSQYQTHPVYKRNQIVGAAGIHKGMQKTVHLMTSEPVSILTRKGEDLKKVTKEITVNKDIQAPVKKGQEIGSIIVKKDSKVLAKSPLVAEKDIPGASWWTFFKRALGEFTKAG
ncbi:D-alanyl-D-alanine carboxypeptidase [Metabacillus sp. GX 13764]|uniref:D-alanyl-D-alanine carboxypeptidase family protein n=1 Tax=Metabacillus kandeliae TaxID=2900151 RepID=UPI001E331533|nr:D-alanyl-D-alanine carboxypeptidase family protein [Metabacillus kandeliae]MCD7033290.1 D-alanyl-D-alanine carboxypeptidase [Metabacillus kandeliae]